VCRKVAHLKEGEVGHRSGSFVCARTGRVGGAEGPSARFVALAGLLFYGIRDHEN
jgi:hypothetical protein